MLNFITCAPRKPDPLFFNDPYFRGALVATVAIGLIASMLATFYFPFGSGSFWGMTSIAILNFSSFVALIVQGCIKYNRP